MTNTEKIIQLLADLKICSETDINKYFVPVLELLPLISGGEKVRVTTEFYEWAKENEEAQPYKLPYAIFLLSAVYYFTEKYELALTTANEARVSFEAANKPDEAALCLSITGGVYRTLGNVELALKALWESYDVLNKYGTYLHNTMACSFNIASIYLDKKNYEEALPLFKNTLATAEKLGNKLFIVNSLQGLAKLYLVHKEYDTAKQAIERALSVAEEIGQPMFIANMQTDLANYFFVTGDLEKSIKLHTEALTTRQEHNLLGGSITNMMQLAEIYDSQNKPEDMIAILDKAMGMALQLKVKLKIYQLHRLLADAYEKGKETEKSLYHYKQFHELREEVEMEDAAKKVKNLQIVFEAEQTRKENIIIKKQKAEIEQKNIELQETIDELTKTRVSRKAKALTLIVALVLFITEDVLLDFVLHRLQEDNIILTLGIKILIVFSLKPIERGIEHYLLKKVIKKKKTVLV